MKKTNAILASLVALSLAAPAFADSNATVKSSATDAAGTTTTAEKTVKVKDAKDGSSETTIKSDTTKDPKGLMNKSEAKSKETVKTDANGTVVKDEKKATSN